MRTKLKETSNKNFTSLIILVTIFALCGLFNLSITSEAKASDWSIETADNSGGSYSSIALDSSKNPHISYYGNTNLMYAYRSGGTWYTETADDSSNNVGSWSSLALDSSGNPHISYYDSSDRDLEYAYKSPDGTWQTESVDGVSSEWGDDDGSCTSMAFDSLDNPHISYYDATNDALKHAYKSDGTWTTETVDSVANAGWHTSIEIDPSNNPHISYQALTGSLLKYAYKSGDIWTTETVDGSIDLVGWYTSLELDSSNNPHISYYDATNGDLKYAYKSGTWQIETVDSTGDVGWNTSLELDSSNNPHISYYDTTNDDLKYTYKSGTWQTETVDSVGDVGSYTSITLDSLNNPYISYYDSTNVDLKFATFSDIISSSASSLSPSNGATAIPLNSDISFTLSDDVQVDQNTLDVTIGGVIAIDNGSCQSGYSCTMTSNGTNGYDVTINPDSDFNYSEEVNIAVTVSDNAGNPLSSSWSFATEEDTDISTISNRIPTDSSSDISKDANIYFELGDISSGININTLTVVLSGNTAISSGSCQSGYSCTMTANGTNGYDVTINPDSDFNSNEEVSVNVSVEDNSGNELASSWVFIIEEGEVVVEEEQEEGLTIDPKIIAISGPGETAKIQAYDRHGNKVGSEINNIFPDFYLGGASIDAIDTNNNGVKDQIIVFAKYNGGPQARLFGLRESGQMVFLGQDFLFDKNIRDGLSVKAGDFDGDGYEDDIASCLTLDGEVAVRVYSDIKGVDNWNLKKEFKVPSLTTGCNLGSLSNDSGADDILVTAHHGLASPNVFIYDANGNLKKKFTAYGEGVVNGLKATGIEDRIVTTPNNGSSHVMTFDREGNPKNFWWAYPQKDYKDNYVVIDDFSNVAGDIDLDGKDEILISPEKKNGLHILSFEVTGKSRSWPNFFAFGDEESRNGVDIAVINNWHGVN